MYKNYWIVKHHVLVQCDDENVPNFTTIKTILYGRSGKGYHKS